MKLRACIVFAVGLLVVVSSVAQDSADKTQPAADVVPRLIKFSGTAKDETGGSISGILGMTFALYKDKLGGSPLWLETQNVRADANGHYTVILGATQPDGLPVELFMSGEARWLGVRTGQQEQPRVLLVSVPYAIKAHEAETFAGRSISDFVLNETQNFPNGGASNRSSATAVNSSTSSSTLPPPAGPTNFSGSNATQIVGVTQTGSGVGLSATAPTHAAVVGTITGPSNTAVYGLASNTSTGSNAAGVTGASNTQLGPGVQGVTASPGGLGVQGVVNSTSGGIAVQGLNRATTGFSEGVMGQTSSTTLNSAGVNGSEAATTGQVYGVVGFTASTTANAAGVSGFEGAATGAVLGVSGSTNSATSGAAGVSGFEGATTGQVFGVVGNSKSSTANAAGVNGFASATTGQVFGVSGGTNSTTNFAAGISGFEGAIKGVVIGVSGGTNSTTTGAAGVSGFEGATAGQVFGVNGSTNSTTTNATGVNGFEGATTGQVFGVAGSTNSTTNFAAGVSGFEGATTGEVYGVAGNTNSTTNFAAGVAGHENAITGIVYGVTGVSNSTTDGAAGVSGIAGGATGSVHGVDGSTSSTRGIGIFGLSGASSGGTGVQGQIESKSGGAAGIFVAHGGGGLILSGLSGAAFTTKFFVDASGNGFYAGNLNITGKLTKGSGSFKIDHPLDPANKYLSHSFVESPDMMNVYNGNVTTDKHGVATVILPEYFEALNRDFRYQLTVIGQFAQAIVKEEIARNQFMIKTSKPWVKVSWQVTGIRHDPYADANRIPVEEQKTPLEQGRYLHPELFGASPEEAIGAAPAITGNETASFINTSLARSR